MTPEQELASLIEAAMDPGAVAAARDTIYVARRDLTTLRARISALEGLLRECRAEIDEQVSAHDGEDPFGTSCPNCVAGVPVPHTLACRITAALTPARKDQDEH